MTSEGIGYGKTILFGEHFVVYGLPAIAAGIESKTIAKVERIKGEGYALEDNRLESPGYKKKKFEQQADSLKRMFAEMKVDMAKTPMRIVLEGDLMAASGLGASAASCVAVARAVAKELGMKLSDERINEIAYEGEKGYHGTPSGIDNTISTYGGLILYKKGMPPLMEHISVKKAIEVIIADTGITADTAAVVAGVRKLKEAEPEKYAPVFARAEGMMKEARAAIESYDLRKVGMLMNENHELLKKIGVSCNELEKLTRVARENGALGAKLTGTGRGGSILALTPGKELQEKVASAIEAEGFSVLKTRIGIKLN